MFGQRVAWRRFGHILLALGCVAVLGSAPAAARAGAHPAASSLSPLGPETTVPFGWLDFCHRHPGDCEETDRVAEAINLTDASFRRIAGVNALVNSQVEPVSDAEHAGVPDSWDYPEDGKGDCEDYALMKRRLLVQAGFPASALLLTVVKDEHGDGHSVLIARTTHGDYVLDNLSEDVKPWTKTPYRFVKRQSQENQNVWVAIGAPTSAPMYVAK
jgi:predicted transglutaminase-like cysteine proteinase